MCVLFVPICVQWNVEIKVPRKCAVLAHLLQNSYWKARMLRNNMVCPVTVTGPKSHTQVM